MPRLSRCTRARRLESEADRLLRTCAADAEFDFRTEIQMRRKAGRELPAGLELPEEPASADAAEELRFLSRLTPLTPPMRRAFVLWAEGETIATIAQELRTSRASAARILKSALVRCWVLGPVTFGQFSAKTVYRPPSSRAARQGHGARCEVCAAPIWDDYDRETCGSPECENVMRQRRRLDRQRFMPK